MIAKHVRNEQNGLQGWQKMLSESYTHPAELLDGYLVPRLIRETSGRDSKIMLDQYLE